MLLALVLAAFVAGLVDAIAGGGGLITLPALLAAGLSPHAALATNKFSSTMGTFVASARYYHAGTMSVRVGLISAAGALVGSAIGARIALLVPASTINSVMLVLVPSVLVFFLLKDRVFVLIARLKGGSPGQGTRNDTARALSIGFFIGVYDGFFGPGTGTFLAIAFSAFLSMDLLQASANARLTNLASNVGSLVVFLWNGQVRFPLALYAAASGIAGNWLGSSLAIKKGERVIKPLMTGVLILLMAEVVRRRYFGG